MIHLRRDGREGSRPRFSAGLRYILLFCDRVPSFLFFSSSFRSCLPFRVARCPLERAVVTFEICWEKEEVG